MLLDFRNNMRGVAIGITIVIALIFAFTGTGSLFISTPDSESALVVNGDEISEREVLQAVARERSRILNENPEMDRSLLDDQALRPQALRQLISREVLIQAANQQDLGVAPSLINDLILAFDLESSLLSAEATIISALKRKESRGSHQRKDYKKTNSKYNFNLMVRLSKSKNVLEVKNIISKDPREDLKQLIRNNENEEISINKLLE